MNRDSITRAGASWDRGAVRSEEPLRLGVLIADDSDEVRDRLAESLTVVEGLSIAALARDGDEAIDLFHALAPSIVILDIRMPGRSGLAVLEEIKRVRPATFVIVCTNYALPPYRARAQALGADLFVSKSLEFDRIPIVVGDWVNRMVQSGTDRPSADGESP